jgi:hypothetical protein
MAIMADGWMDFLLKTSDIPGKSLCMQYHFESRQNLDIHFKLSGFVFEIDFNANRSFLVGVTCCS